MTPPRSVIRNSRFHRCRTAKGARFDGRLFFQRSSHLQSTANLIHHFRVRMAGLKLSPHGAEAADEGASARAPLMCGELKRVERVLRADLANRPPRTAPRRIALESLALPARGFPLT